MGFGAVAEPLIVVTLLFGGTWINRQRSSDSSFSQSHHGSKRGDSRSRQESGQDVSVDDERQALLGQRSLEHACENGWRRREMGIAGWKKEVWSPDTKVFEDRLLSRVLQAFPFLVEVWYWALIYWVYQLGRALTALTLVEGTVNIARKHALQLIHLEQRVHIFHEGAIQAFFLGYPSLMHWINRIYSFIHIPGTILFLVWLYNYTTVLNRPSRSSTSLRSRSSAGPRLFQARRRTMAMCNLIAFIVFTAWPCMPPRLLSDPNYKGEDAAEAKSYDFVDTVHGAKGESSVWTQNKFCNQYAAMPSLHFGYSLLVGLTIMTIPIAPRESPSSAFCGLKMPVWRRMLSLVLGFLYPAIILVAIISTANHFILDAVAGAMVCALAWSSNRLLLNLLPLEDWFLWCLRLHKPDVYYVEMHVVEDR